MLNLDGILYKVTKPARYTGHEWNSVVKDWDGVEVKLALAYPDVYEIGMSNLGLAILYDVVNRQPHLLAERFYTPWPDMASAMQEAGIPLFSLESRHWVRDFDVVGFSLGYELTYTNVLQMLHLAGIPLHSWERGEGHPLVVAGGSCAVNPEPMADFVDCFVIGEGEEVILELAEVCRGWKKEGKGEDRKGLLKSMAELPGVYVPSLYPGGHPPQALVRRRVVSPLPPPLTRPVVPYISVVHDRAMVEIQRGCPRACRFCQAGVIYRPLRRRTPQEVMEAVEELLKNTGYNELSLLSLSSSDYPEIQGLVKALVERYQGRNLAISLPSLRIDSFTIPLAQALSGAKKPSLTFAPEAGSQRLRDVLRKGVTEDDLLRATQAAFSHGLTSVKLYFMVGLPTETLEDVQEIVRLVGKVREEGRKHASTRFQIKVSVAAFIPKPHTPFQWAPLCSEEELEAKFQILKRGLKKLEAHLSWQDPQQSWLEAALARGDGSVGRVIEEAWRRGCVFDAWSQDHRYQEWQQAFETVGLDPDYYTRRPRALEEPLPWDHIHCGVNPAVLRQEYRQAVGT